jgi:hypothetical protein
MEFEQFATARDFFYLASIFLGAALGFMLCHFRKRSPRRIRNRSLALAFCCLSAMTVSLAAAIIISQVQAFAEISVYLTGAVLAALLVIAVRFPRAAGFPLILLAGIAAVWVGFSFLRYPIANPAAPVVSYAREGLSSDREVIYTRLSVPRFYPLIGGETRGILDYTDYTEMRRIPGLAVDHLHITVPAAPGTFGMVSIYIEDDGLVIK